MGARETIRSQIMAVVPARLALWISRASASLVRLISVPLALPLVYVTAANRLSSFPNRNNPANAHQEQSLTTPTTPATPATSPTASNAQPTTHASAARASSSSRAMAQLPYAYAPTDSRQPTTILAPSA